MTNFVNTKQFTSEIYKEKRQLKMTKCKLFVHYLILCLLHRTKQVEETTIKQRYLNIFTKTTKDERKVGEPKIDRKE